MSAVITNFDDHAAKESRKALHEKWAARDVLRVSTSLPAPGRNPWGVTFNGEYLWVSDPGTAKIYALDPLVGTVQATLPFLGKASGLACDSHHLWQADSATRVIYCIDPIHRQTVSTLKMPRSILSIGGIALHGDKIWFSDPIAGLIHQYDLVFGSIQKTFCIDRHITGLSLANNFLLAADDSESAILVLDSETLRLHRTLRVDGHPHGISYYRQSLWVADRHLAQILCLQHEIF